MQEHFFTGQHVLRSEEILLRIFEDPAETEAPRALSLMLDEFPLFPAQVPERTVILVAVDQSPFPEDTVRTRAFRTLKRDSIP